MTTFNANLSNRTVLLPQFTW